MASLECKLEDHFLRAVKGSPLVQNENVPSDMKYSIVKGATQKATMVLYETGGDNFSKTKRKFTTVRYVGRGMHRDCYVGEQSGYKFEACLHNIILVVVVAFLVFVFCATAFNELVIVLLFGDCCQL